MEYLKPSFSTMTGSNDDPCKCFKGEKCENYHIKCKDCVRIQGKYTEWKSTSDTYN